MTILFMVPRDAQAAHGYGAAARAVRMPRRCPYGHAYPADTAILAWEPCPCWPGFPSGHHLIICRVCRDQRLPALACIPECIYLGI